jgi:hypothetical protein
MGKKLTLDKYASDAHAWRQAGDLYYTATATLYESNNLLMYLPAATMGHHTLERYLKAALISVGMTVCPHDVAAANGIGKADYEWGHKLTDLAKKLRKKRPTFDPDVDIGISVSILGNVPPTLMEGLRHFEPYFDELRYPQELSKLEGAGMHEFNLLNCIVGILRPLTFPILGTQANTQKSEGHD